MFNCRPRKIYERDITKPNLCNNFLFDTGQLLAVIFRVINSGLIPKLVIVYNTTLRIVALMQQEISTQEVLSRILFDVVFAFLIPLHTLTSHKHLVINDKVWLKFSFEFHLKH